MKNPTSKNLRAKVIGLKFIFKNFYEKKVITILYYYFMFFIKVI